MLESRATGHMGKVSSDTEGHTLRKPGYVDLQFFLKKMILSESDRVDLPCQGCRHSFCGSYKFYDRRLNLAREAECEQQQPCETDAHGQCLKIGY